MTKYLLEDFSAVDGTDVRHPTQAIVDESQIIAAIDKAHKEQTPIRVHIIGPCLLDWSPKNVPRGTPKPAPKSAATESDGRENNPV